MTPAAPPKPKRLRLSPDVRKDLILDHAAALVVGAGVSAVSMERVGRDAGVSKALVYAYFPNRDALLSALLLREVRRFQREGRAAAAEAGGDFDALLRNTSRAYLLHVKTRGVLIQRLMNEPSVAAAVRTIDAEERTITAAFLARKVAQRYGLRPDLARLSTELLMGVTGAAGEVLDRSGEDVDHLADLILLIVTSALQGLAARGADAGRGERAGRTRRTSPAPKA